MAQNVFNVYQSPQADARLHDRWSRCVDFVLGVGLGMASMAVVIGAMVMINPWCGFKIHIDTINSMATEIQEAASSYTNYSLVRIPAQHLIEGLQHNATAVRDGNCVGALQHLEIQLNETRFAVDDFLEQAQGSIDSKRSLVGDMKDILVRWTPFGNDPAMKRDIDISFADVALHKAVQSALEKQTSVLDYLLYLTAAKYDATVGECESIRSMLEADEVRRTILSGTHAWEDPGGSSMGRSERVAGSSTAAEAPELKSGAMVDQATLKDL